jgi:excisionase family DNA binding protein
VSLARRRVNAVELYVKPGASVEEIAAVAGLYPYDVAVALRSLTRRHYSRALRDGVLVRPERCSDCGAGGTIHGHHPDYTRPLHVEWLCVRCHRSRHTSSELGKYQRRDVTEHMKPLMTVRDAAGVLRVPLHEVYSRVRSGALPHLRIGRMIRFRPSDLERAVA